MLQFLSDGLNAALLIKPVIVVTTKLQLNLIGRGKVSRVRIVS